MRKGNLNVDMNRGKTMWRAGRRWLTRSQGEGPGADPSCLVLSRNQPCQHRESRLPGFRTLCIMFSKLTFWECKFTGFHRILTPQPESLVKQPTCRLQISEDFMFLSPQYRFLLLWNILLPFFISDVIWITSHWAYFMQSLPPKPRRFKDEFKWIFPLVIMQI